MGFPGLPSIPSPNLNLNARSEAGQGAGTGDTDASSWTINFGSGAVDSRGAMALPSSQTVLILVALGVAWMLTHKH